MSKEAYYFSHDSNARNDPKILQMRSVYKSEGYGWFWILVEMMREQEDFKLSLEGECVWNAFAMQTQCDADAIKRFALDCINRFKLFSSDGEYFWSDSLIRRMKQRDEKSEKARKSALSRWAKKEDANAMQTQCERNAIKGKERKGNRKESKDSIPYAKIQEAFNVTCPSFASVQMLSQKRKDKIKLRWGEIGALDKFILIFSKMEKSDFMKGATKNGWVATFDWLMDNDNNWVKVLEGQYDNKSPGQTPTPKNDKFKDFHI